MEGPRLIPSGDFGAKLINIAWLHGSCRPADLAHSADSHLHGIDQAVFLCRLQAVLRLNKGKKLFRPVPKLFLRFFFSASIVSAWGMVRNSLLVKPVIIGTSRNFPAAMLFQ